MFSRLLLLSLIGLSFIFSAEAQCESNPCRNGGICEPNFSKPNTKTRKKVLDFNCRCLGGYTGDQCEWPCVDVYKSCDALWKNERRCTVFKQWTEWYDTNCPVTCGVCTTDFRTLPKEGHPPFAPILEPVMWLIGKWRLESKDYNHFPVRFDVQGPFIEEIEFAVAQVPMFGTPCLNYTAYAYREGDRTDIQEEHGFITVQDRWKVYPVKVALMRTNNNGAVLFEEGPADLNSSSMNLNLTFWKASPHVKRKFPVLATRRFTAHNDYLEIETTEQKLNEPSVTYTHFYLRNLLTNSFTAHNG